MANPISARFETDSAFCEEFFWSLLMNIEQETRENEEKRASIFYYRCLWICGAIREMKSALRTRGKATLSEPNTLNPFLLIKGIFHILLGTQENMILRSIKWRFTKIFKKVSLGSVCSKNIIFTPRGTDRNVIDYFVNVEEKLEKTSLFNNVSACFVVVGEKS